MAYLPDDDLLTRIQLQNGCTRDGARRILRDLIDHHKRISVSAASRGRKKTYRAPITSISTDPYIQRIGTPEVSDTTNPNGKTRKGDVAPPSIQKRQPHHRKKGHQQSPYIVIPYNSHILSIPKKDFIQTAWDHGMTAAEIRDFIVPYMFRRGYETQAEFKRRIGQQVWQTVHHYRHGRSGNPRIPRHLRRPLTA